ncbi:MAG: hypothetical protein A2Y62_03905 [Candidatus Fischerbacteria bacterium RBG_13_37_8]|uniref:HEAT repeat domain-containing protein n=1 Tax=Candidatus Fischerbacteria bacterium RBG_13_37_8 TaxID=1817863 RepID=A0A1F5V5E7_9BACT|nr:MAG: hypothetical protein A2Y62_03905 [Candidatus Fischerbacteria bacterium RBG_13_37_8]
MCKLLEHSNSNVKIEAIELLYELKSPFSIGIFKKHLLKENEEPDVRYWLVFALCKFGTEEAFEAISQALRDENEVLLMLAIRNAFDTFTKNELKEKIKILCEVCFSNDNAHGELIIKKLYQSITKDKKIKFALLKEIDKKYKNKKKIFGKYI